MGTATAPILAGRTSSSSWTLAWSNATVAGATSTVQAHTVQPPTVPFLDYPHDPHISPVDQGTVLVLGLGVTGIVIRDRFRFVRSPDAAH